MKVNNKHYRTIWMKDDIIHMIHQNLLPHSFEIFEAKNIDDTARAIKDMIIRGAPAIGAAGAFGLAQAAMQFKGKKLDEFFSYMEKSKKTLNETRPTANDLDFALSQIMQMIKDSKEVGEAVDIAVNAAKDYAEWSVNTCKQIGINGEKLIDEGAWVLTHCNAGALATVDYGTALAPIRFAHYAKKDINVFVDETRPRLQGASLTAFELKEEGIKHSIIADNAAGYYLQNKEIDIVIVGADRIAMNGDIANKIGTYEKAVVAHENKVPFYVAAPVSTIDVKAKSGKDIPIEERSQDEILYINGWTDKGERGRVRIAPKGCSAQNPAFDITPAKFIKGIITDKGIFKPGQIKKAVNINK